MEYSVQAAGRATGISPWRIRTWERRYGVPVPRRDPGGRRVYSEADLAVLRRMAVLVEQGLAASLAAEAIQREGVEVESATEPLPSVDPRVEFLLTAATSFEQAGCVRTIREAALDLGWGEALEVVVMPAMAAMGALWERGEVSPAVEHFLSQLVQRELLAVVSQLDVAAVDAPLLLIACAEDEFHDLGAMALWLLLSERGARVIYLGADVPARALSSAVQTARPDVVCLTGVSANSAPMLAESARALLNARTGAEVFVGGPALINRSADLVPAVRLPSSLQRATELLFDAATKKANGAALIAQAPSGPSVG